jgi:hypothetical protein
MFHIWVELLPLVKSNVLAVRSQPSSGLGATRSLLGGSTLLGRGRLGRGRCLLEKSLNLHLWSVLKSEKLKCNQNKLIK